LWYNVEAREQDYKHWDFAGGVNYNVADSSTVGITAGYLWGTATQSLTRQDTSFYGYGTMNVDKNWGYYKRSGITGQQWDHQGKSFYAGINFRAQLNKSQALTLYYLFTRQNVDIVLGSSITDTSYNSYRSQWDTTVYRSESDYLLRDVRSGTGNKLGIYHRFMATLQWQVESHMMLSIGVHVNVQTNTTDTKEAVFANRSSRYESFYSSNRYSYLDGAKEDKNLLWNFRTNLTTFQIPIILTWRVSEKVELLFGLNRTISSWEIVDMTLALFNYREQTNNSTTTRETNFGERYTMPKENVSDIRTTALGGITIFPSKLFNVRVLVAPDFVENRSGSSDPDFQWWIGVSLFP
jgi:hypothetical protein